MSLTKIGSIGINTGIQLAGVTTIATLNASDNVLSVGGTVNFVDNVSFGGTVSIAGTLTYEDVTNVDSVGLITARNGIVVGSGITLSKDGDIFATGISTFSEGFAGDILIDDKIVHRGDTNTAIRFADADTITAETGGSERLRITSEGKIGIGDASPDALLVIKGNSDSATTPSIRLKDGSDTREAWITNTAGDLLLVTGGDDNTPHCKLTLMDGNIIHFSTANTERMRLDSSGRLLIGTTTEGQADADNLTIADSGSCGITIRSGTSAAGAIYFSDATSGAAEYDGAIIYNQSSQYMDFYTGQSQNIRINSDGDLGVNNTSPSAKLDVVSADASGYIAEFRQSNTSNSGQIIIDSPTDGDSRPVLIDMARAGTVKWSIGQGYNSSGGAFHIATSTLQSGVSNAKVTINTDGDMGVGTGGNDPTQRLDVRESNSSTFNAASNLPTQIRAYNTSPTNGACAGIQLRADNNAGAAGIQYIHVVNSSTAYDSDLVFSRRIASSGTYAETARFTNVGNLKFPSGKGIDFSATSDTSSVQSELFDDYEEGSWTPAITFGGGNTGLTYQYQVGRYIKIGNMVHIKFGIRLSNRGSSTGGARVIGLPYNGVHSSYYHDSGALITTDGVADTNEAHTNCFVTDTNKLALRQGSFGNQNRDSTHTMFGNNTALFGSLTYNAGA